MQQEYWHFVRIDDGHEKMDSFRELCRGHQRTMDPCSKREREKERERKKNLTMVRFFLFAIATVGTKTY